MGRCLVLLVGMAHFRKGFLIIVLQIHRKGFLLHGWGVRIYLLVRLVVEDEILVIVLGDELWVMVDLHLQFFRKELVNHLKEPSFMQNCL